MKKFFQKFLFFIILGGSFLMAENVFSINTATLKIAHNDGILCFLNGIEFINTLNEPQTERYWNKEIDILRYLSNGENVLACRVSNGDGNPGSGIGYFDVELIVDSQIIIKRGSENWKYFGQGNSTTPPPADRNNRSWYLPNYDDSSWPIGSTPFDGRRGPVLTKAPDDAWFRKKFYISGLKGYQPPSNGFDCLVYNSKDACLSIPYCFWTGSNCLKENLVDCQMINNKDDCLRKKDCQWFNSKCIKNEDYYQQNIYQIKSQILSGCFKPIIHKIDKYLKPPLEKLNGLIFSSPTPLITGLVQYGNQVKVFIDDNFITEAVVKEGEETGVANFYFKIPESAIPLIDDLKVHKLKILAINKKDQSICESPSINFIVTPYPAPILHQLGEISFLPRADNLKIKDRKPIITGLVKYGSIVEIFIDDKFVGRAKIQGGEKTGIANFYLKLEKELSPGKHTLYAIAKKAGQELIKSQPSQIFTFFVE